MSIGADDNLTTCLSLWPTAAVSMAGPSSTSLDELKEELDKFRRLAAEELSKGKHSDDHKAALYQEQAKITAAQIDRQTSGAATLFMGLCCVVKRHLTQAQQVSFSMHTHAIVSRASWKHEARCEVCRCCGPPAQSGCLQWSVNAQIRRCWAGDCDFWGTMAFKCWAVPGDSCEVPKECLA